MKTAKRTVFAGTAILAAALILGCARAPVQREAGKTYELVLLHTNDHHGAIEPRGGLGGLAERAAFVKQVRERNANVLLVDAGDINTGPALSNMFEAEPDFRAYNLIGYDVGTFGNHEFDGDMAKLDRQIQIADFPLISGNIRRGGKFLGDGQYLVKDYDGFRVGLVGITTLRTKIIASPDPGLEFLPEIEAARAAVDRLRNRERADIVIAITHMGDVKEAPDHVTAPELAAAVPGIDIIVDGHSHSFFAAAQKAGDTWIVTANEWGKYAGQGRLTIVDGRLADFAWEPVAINTAAAKTYAPDPETAALLQPYIEQASARLHEVAGQAAGTFIFGNRLTRYGETALGDMITDANVWYIRNVQHLQVDFAFHNGGNMRAELPEGPLTREQILTVLPFENYLFIASLRGAEIQGLFDFIATIPQGAGGFPQFSGEVRYTLDIPNQRITDLTIGGVPVDPDRVYRFCTNDYLLKGGDGYTVLTRSENQFNTSLLLSYVVIEYIAAQNGVIAPATDGRMTVIGGVTP